MLTLILRFIRLEEVEMSKASYMIKDRVVTSEVIRPRYQTRRKTIEKKSDSAFWFAFCLILLSGFVFCLATNLRAQRELNEESRKYEALSKRADFLRHENRILEEEIEKLKSDPSTIAREARKLGMGKPNEKIFVSAE